MINKVRSSLTVRIFIITALILFSACGLTYTFILFATPINYSNLVNDDLNLQLGNLVSALERTTHDASTPLIEDFQKTTGFTAVINKYNYEAIDTNGVVPIADDYKVTAIKQESDYGITKIFSNYLTAFSFSVTTDFTFTDSDERYMLSLFDTLDGVNYSQQAMQEVFPYIVLMILIISLLGSLFYSRYITKPVVKLSKISQKIADLDFTYKYETKRADEIGILGKNLNTLSTNLSTSIEQLRLTNQQLKLDIDRERKLERQRTTFFSAVSHELKTPITILKGQISGMLSGIDVYKDKEKYLDKSLAVTKRMEKLVQEILTISRIECDSFTLNFAPINLSDVISEQAGILKELAMQKNQIYTTKIESDIQIIADNALIMKVVSNLIANAILYSPNNSEISIILESMKKGAVLTVKNNGVTIPEEALPHLFEAFYRVDTSRNSETGGSGLGLYLVKMILDKHNFECKIIPTDDQVTSKVIFNC